MLTTGAIATLTCPFSTFICNTDRIHATGKKTQSIHFTYSIITTALVDWRMLFPAALEGSRQMFAYQRRPGFGSVYISYRWSGRKKLERFLLGNSYSHRPLIAFPSMSASSWVSLISTLTIVQPSGVTPRTASPAGTCGLFRIITQGAGIITSRDRIKAPFLAGDHNSRHRLAILPSSGGRLMFPNFRDNL